MSKKNSEKLSEAELIKKIARYEKSDRRWKRIGFWSLIIGILGALLGYFAEVLWIVMMCTAFFVFGGIYFLFLNGRSRRKAESLLNAHLDDFYDAELKSAFGPCRKTKEMDINESLIKELRPVTEYWNECYEWRFYEGYYHGIHFSIENVDLSEVKSDPDGRLEYKKFEGAVLRCKDICDPTLDIALCGSGTDHQSDLMDPTVFCQFFSARAADGQPADHLVTPQLRELIQKMESIGKKYKVTALIFRNGEVIMAIRGYDFGYGLPSRQGSLQDINGIRSHFIESLTPVCNLIDILRDSCGKL